MSWRMIAAGGCVLAAIAGSVWGAEQSASLSDVFAVAPGVEGGLPQYYPETAWAKESKVWLVVWEDGYATGDETARGGRAKDIFAARVSADGKVLDPQGIPVCAAKDFQGRPCVASDGKDFLVVWHDMRNGKDHDLYAARVTADGKVLDRDGVLVSGEPRNQVFPDVVFGGGNYYAVWLDARHFPPEYRVYGARISPAGKVLDAKGTELIRLLTDEQVAAWAKEPFGGHDAVPIGWVKHSLQPGPPSVATNGKTHVVAALMERMMADHTARFHDHVVQQVDAAAGSPVGEPDRLNFMRAVRYGEWGKKNLDKLGVHRRHGRPHVVSTGEKGFMVAFSSYFPSAWGTAGDVFWLAAFLDTGGKAVPGDGKDIRFRFVYGDDRQRQYGARGKGLRANRPVVVSDGKRVLYVNDRYLHLKGALRAGNKPGDFTGDHDVLGLFVDDDGKRIADPATGGTVEPDPLDPAKMKGGCIAYAGTPELTPFEIATGEALQANPAAAAGEEGVFLVVWQEETLEQEARITGRLVRVK